MNFFALMKSSVKICLNYQIFTKMMNFQKYMLSAQVRRAQVHPSPRDLIRLINYSNSLYKGRLSGYIRFTNQLINPQESLTYFIISPIIMITKTGHEIIEMITETRHEISLSILTYFMSCFSDHLNFHVLFQYHEFYMITFDNEDFH